MRKILVFLALFSTPKKVLAWGVAFIAAGVIAAAVLTTPQSIDLDGTNDYLSRASDFSGNADGKEFTFSCWVYKDDLTGSLYLYSAGSTFTDISFVFDDTDFLKVILENSAGSTILRVDTPTGGLTSRTWTHLLISADLSNSSNRSVYINDSAVSPTWTTYTDDNINWTNTKHSIGASATGTSLEACRLSHVYLDYTYRDLSVEATRRNWITADLKPAATAVTAALNPIVYFPMTDPDTWGDNSGTGGNMTENGTVAASGRGPNQDNCVASVFDGTADYLTRGADLTGNANAKTITGAFTYKPEAAGIDYIYSTANTQLDITFTASNEIRIVGLNAADATILDVKTPAQTLNKNIHVAYSIDLANSGNRWIEIDGAAITPTWTTYTDDTLDLTDTDHSIGATTGGTSLADGWLGEYWFDHVYTATSPFWDSTLNKPIPVRQVIEDTGVTPLIAMPIRGDDAGANLGSGGDFTVNSGPYTGARGASEFWARSVVVDNSNYLSHASISCESLIKVTSADSGATWTVTTSNSTAVTDIGNGTDNGVIGYVFGTSENITWATESELLRFIDAFGYPVEPTVDANTLIYLPFDDATNFGKNEGSASDFTETGTVTQGADVTNN